MAISGCTNGLAVTAVLALLLLPAQYYFPDLYLGSTEPVLEPQSVLKPSPANVTQSWFLLDFPPLDLFITVSLVIIAMVTYFCDWIQRKLMEKRIQKLNHYISECIDLLRGWDARQEQLEATLRMVQNGTSEYNLLLFLLLRQHRLGTPARPPPSHCFFDKELDDLNFITNTEDFRQAAA